MEETLKDNNDEEEVKEPVKRHQNRQVMWIFFLMIVIIVLIFAVPYYISNYSTKFTYKNLDFQTTKMGKVTLYSTNVPLTSQKVSPITGAFISKDKVSGKYAIDFRNDPRKIDPIQVHILNNTVMFKGNQVYITMNPEDKPCPQNVIAPITLLNFLTDFGTLKVDGAVTDEKYAEANKVPYKTCDNSPYDTVLWLKEGTENSINMTAPNCYELTYTNCEVLPVSEKFILTILEGYMSFFEGGEKLKRPLLPDTTPTIYKLR